MHANPLVPKGPILGALRKQGDPSWRVYVRSALETSQSVGGAAKALGIPRRTLDRWLHEDPTLREGLSLPRPGFYAHAPRPDPNPDG